MLHWLGFGQSGPYAKRPAYDDIIQGVSGMAAMQGGREGNPTFVNASVCDKICSQIAAHATLAALFAAQSLALDSWLKSLCLSRW